jgi:hypothetical protein
MVYMIIKYYNKNVYRLCTQDDTKHELQQNNKNWQNTRCALAHSDETFSTS